MEDIVQRIMRERRETVSRARLKRWSTPREGRFAARASRWTRSTRPKTRSGLKEPRNWVLVVELDDVVPRRDPEKPNLYVALTIQEPDKKFGALLAGKGPSRLDGHLVRLRDDLTSGPFLLREDAEKEKRAAVACLKKEGFTVNRDASVWTVYVIELDPRGTKNAGKGFVYVGQTSLTPEERFEQHKKGKRNVRGPLFSPVVRKRGVRLRMDLAPATKFFDRASAEAAEKRWCRKLKDEGYLAVGGH